MNIFRNLRYTYYCADRKWKRFGVRRSSSSDYLIMGLLLVWLADLALLGFCVRGGHVMPPISNLTRWWIGGVFAGVAGVLSVYWSVKGDPIVDRMYSEFEPDGVPLPVNRKRILNAVPTPLAVFAFLSVVALWLIRIDGRRQRAAPTEAMTSEARAQVR
jgi:hypothetical protein